MAQKLNIANFICKFGEQLVLLDMLHEVVIPAFTGAHERAYGDDVRYFFHGVEILDVSDTDTPEVAIAGRFVKEGKVARDQVYVGGRIVKDHQELDTAPSSFFVLLLSNHKLLYVRENSGAPLISTFESTISAFLKSSYRTWISDEFERRKEIAPITKKALIGKSPPPIVEIVELSTNSEIHAFVKKFRVINTVEIQLLNTNHETDNEPLFRNLRVVQNRLGSNQLTIKNTKNGDVGLNKTDVANLVSGQAEEANARIILRGKDLEGETMNAVNDHFKLSISVENLPQQVRKGAVKLIETFRRQVRSGIVNVKKAPVSALRTLNKFRTGLE
jgi:hypothetical protein